MRRPRRSVSITDVEKSTRQRYNSRPHPHRCYSLSTAVCLKVTALLIASQASLRELKLVDDLFNAVEMHLADDGSENL